MNDRKEYIFKCKKCGEEYKLYLTEYELKSGRYSKHCSRQCANSHKVSEETKNKISSAIKKKIENGEKVGCINSFNKKILIKRICRYCNQPYYPSKTKLYSYKYCSEECKQKYHDEILPIKLSKLGGYRNGSGYGKSGWYKGIHCDSSWELAFVIYHLEHNLNIERCKEIRKYFYKNQEHKYFPDFVTDEGLIEIKGYSSEQWEAKRKQNPDIKILYKSDIQLYLDYVIKKYGTNFIDLYDNSNPKDIDVNKINLWVHKYDDNAKIYYTKIINPKDFEKHISDGWLSGKGKCYEGYQKKHIKTKNIFKR